MDMIRFAAQDFVRQQRLTTGKGPKGAKTNPMIDDVLDVVMRPLEIMGSVRRTPPSRANVVA